MNGFTFRKPTMGNPVYVTETWYNYSPNANNSTVGSILGSDYGWLASQCVNLSMSYPSFCVCYARSIEVTSNYVYNFNTGSRSLATGVRPLVTLSSSKIKLTGVGDGTSLSPYEIIKK